MKYGLGDVTLAKVFNFFGDETSKAAKLKGTNADYSLPGFSLKSHNFGKNTLHCINS